MVVQTRQVRITFGPPILPSSNSNPLSNVQVSNSITTAKYSYSTFFPKFLFEQFRRYSNIFFSIIALFQQIPNVSPTGRYTTAVPLICILTVSAIKELFEDMKRHRADKKVNETEIHVLNKITLEWQLLRWKDVKVGDIVKCNSENFFPSDMVLLSSSANNGMCYIETANLDGETNLKIRQSLPCTAICSSGALLQETLSGATIDCDLPNPRLYEFEGRLNMPGNIETYPLGPDNILLRGAKLKNTQWVYGAVLYTGHESKLMINSLSDTPIKQSRLEKTTNTQILWLVALLLGTGFISAIFSGIWNYGNTHWYIFGTTEVKFNFAMTFLTFVILYNNLVPISLQVSLEVVRTFQAHFINSDLEMYDKESDTFAMARTSNLNEELGQVRYILSDKTGTLTRNIMTFKRCIIDGKIYDDSTFNLLSEKAQNEIPSDYHTAINQGDNLLDKSDNHSRMVCEFLTLLSVCHTVVPEREHETPTLNVDHSSSSGKLVAPEKAPTSKAPKLSHSKKKDYKPLAVDSNDNEPIEKANEFMMSESANSSRDSSSLTTMVYHAASPDEAALVKGAASIGFEFCHRTADRVLVNKFGREEEYELLNVFEFDSFRKRMSVIIRTQDNQIKIYTKGADTVIYERLSKSNSTEITSQHLQKFAHDGYRTLCCAYAVIDEEKYKSWCLRYKEANLQYGDIKIKELEACMAELEKDLILLGATAIEDKLQEDVSETIDTILKAGISFWLLTGDKQETAINIGFSCKLLSRKMPLIIINEETFESTRDKVLSTVTTSETALVIDGKCLEYALSNQLKRDFMQIALNCKSVICCRVSPFQKAEMVQLVKDLTGEVTLAIGDGANDVAMIRTANIGVGISGTEGLQAAHSADYTISQFKFLARLLLVHGSWSITRLRKMILYSFYKNIALYVVEFWFAIVSGWSGQTIFERWTIGLYNVIFTAAPPFAMGVFDRKCSAEEMMKHPELYKINIENQKHSIRKFWLWIATAFWHSLLLFWFTYFIIYHDTLWSSGKSDGGYLVFGNILYTYVVVTVCLKSGLEMSSWTILTHLAIWGSIASWFVFLLIYSKFWPTFPIAPDMVAIDQLVFSTWVFWLGLALVPFTALMLDVVCKVCHNKLPPRCLSFLWE